jgi:uncharacterized membrane protein YkvI
MATRINYCGRVVLVCFIFSSFAVYGAGGGGGMRDVFGLSYQSSFTIQINGKLDFHLRILA